MPNLILKVRCSRWDISYQKMQHTIALKRTDTRFTMLNVRFIGRAPKNEFAVLNTSLQRVILEEEKPMAEIMKCDLKEIQPGMYICSVSDDMRADLEEK